jgi:hypothetical protein
MTTSTQIAEWREKFESRYDLSQLGTVYGRYLDLTVREAWGNYVEAREDALTEIADLKAKLAEVMPLAKFGAMFLRELEPDYSEVVTEFCLGAGVLDTASEYAPKIKATITKLLKD